MPIQNTDDSIKQGVLRINPADNPPPANAQHPNNDGDSVFSLIIPMLVLALVIGSLAAVYLIH